jgi:hypothetical protein
MRAVVSGWGAAENKLQPVDRIFDALTVERQRMGAERKGFGPGDVFATPKGMYGPTEAGDLEQIIPALAINRGGLRLVDLGSGAGKLAIPLAVLCPNLAEVVGVEHAWGLLLASRAAAQRAEDAGIIKAGQVKFFQGDFFETKFQALLRMADRVFYYLGSSNDEDRLAGHLGRLVHKPHARVVAYGDNPDPFPQLRANWGFRSERGPGGLLTAYIR